MNAKKRNRFYAKWRRRTLKLLKKRAKIQTKSVHKLQKRITNGVRSLNVREGFTHKWKFSELADLVLAALFKPCIYCLQQLHWKKWCIDHKRAVSRGGKNNPENIQIICEGCNRAKSDISHKTHIKMMNFLRTLPPNEASEYVRLLRHGGSYHSKRSNLKRK